MPDREKVIKGLNSCARTDGKYCGHCPYTNEGDCVAIMSRDVLALLKEQQHKIWELNEINEYLDDVKKDQEHQIDVLKEQFDKGILVRCKDCKHGSLYCTEDVCGETLIECNRPDVGDVIEIHGWKWFCADGERKEGR